MKQFYAKLLLLALCATAALPSRAYDCVVDGIYYDLVDSTASVVRGETKYQGYIAIPDTIIVQDVKYEVVSVGDSAFADCDGLTSISFPYRKFSLTTRVSLSYFNIGEYAFSGCTALTTVYYPSSISALGAYSFKGCSNLHTIGIEMDRSPIAIHVGGQYYHTYYGMKKIEEGAFQDCVMLSKITLPSTVKQLGDKAFQNCAELKSAIFDGVEIIGTEAFSGCESLDSLTISEKLATVGSKAFSGCTLSTVSCYVKEPISISDDVFDSLTDSATLYVPTGQTSAYRNSVGWNKFENIFDMYNDGDVFQDSTVEGVTMAFRVTSKINKTAEVYGRYRPAGTGSGGVYSTEILSPCVPTTTAGNITIPEQLVGGHKITGISRDAFRECKGISAVCIPKAVASIGSDAFKGCNGLMSVVSLIGNPFNVDSLLFNDLPDNSTLYVPSGTISSYKSASGWKAFTNIEEMDNYDESELFTASSKEGVPITFRIIDDAEKIVEVYGFKLVTEAVKPAIDASTTGILSIPDSISGYKVHGISSYAFYRCTGLTSIEIPNSVTYIGGEAFSGCIGIKDVTINSNHVMDSLSNNNNFKTIFGNNVEHYTVGDSVTTIGSYAFYDCTGMKSVAIGNSVANIGSYAFGGCTRLTNVTIPNSVTSIGNQAFDGCTGLKKVEISDIAAWCNISFSDADANPLSCAHHLYMNGEEVKELVIPDGVTSIGSSAFSYCTGLTSVTFPNSVTSIGTAAFIGCTGLEKVEISDIAAWCNISFSDAASNPLDYAHHLYMNGEEVKELVIPDGVTSIGSYAFYDCTGLTSITIPNSVTSIGSYAFCDCTGLKKVEISDIAAWCNISFSNAASNPLSCAHHLYLNGEEVKELVIPDGVTGIGKYAFDRCTGLTSVTIPNSVTSIGSYAFYGCTGLASVTFGNNMTSISSSAFEGCNNPDFYVHRGITPTLLTLWKQGLPNTIYEIETGRDINTWYELTASSIRINNFEPADGYTKVSESTTINDVEGNYLKGLRPEQTISSLTWKIQLENAEGSVFNYTFTKKDFRLPALLLNTQQPKVISAGNVIVAAESNLDDEEEKVGFEWRRTDWTDDFASNTGTAYLFNGMMEGYIRNLYTEKLWKYRPYYESNSGQRYYGEWVGIDPTNTSYFEPTVHTYATATVNGNEATVRGYAMRGTDNVSSQGFVYWPVSNGGNGNAAPAVPQDAMRVEATGTVMQASLTDLSYETDYCYMAYVTTAEGETFYGEQQQFRTGTDTSGVTAPRATAQATVVAYYDLRGRRYATPQPGLNIVLMSDGTTHKVVKR